VPDMRFSQVRVLVVDDDPMMAELLSMLLRDCGLTQVDTADDGHAALDFLSRRPADLLICDLNMPGMDGVQLISRVAALERRPSIILLSGEDPRILESSRQFAEAKELKVLGVLGKPVARGPLVALLRQHGPKLELRGGGQQHVPIDAAHLRAGLEGGAISLFYQPKVDLRSGRTVGVEGLLRWQDPVSGLLPTRDVVAAVERCGMIDELTLVILARAARDRRSAADRGLALNFAVNLSMKNLSDAGIVDRMLDIVAGEGCEPSDFTLELTETHLVEDLARVLEPLLRLRLLGFRIALDDYGTGASTMQMLSQLPSSEMKIDRSFVTAGPRSPQGRILLQSAVELGLRMDQTIVAEGIETVEERALVLELGCHVGQGHLFARPLPFDALLDWSRAQAGTRSAEEA
jgi:EAL domain-containing protein (putative c-di-GMP-specific phosphodiesterase class I)